MTLNIDAFDAIALARRTGAPRVELFDTVGSSMDEAHRLAERGAESGTIVVAERQFSGRGRFGRRWISDPGRGLWATFIYRGVDVAGLDVLSIRTGVALAPMLDRFASGRVMIKWPNDLFVGGLKLGGILIEARWRDVSLEWVAIGIGINLIPPADQARATALRAGVLRSEILCVVAAEVGRACAKAGNLTLDELRDFHARDFAHDAVLAEPAPGRARGITPNGALVVETASGRELFRRGSLVFQPGAE